MGSEVGGSGPKIQQILHLDQMVEKEKSELREGNLG